MKAPALKIVLKPRGGPPDESMSSDESESTDDMADDMAEDDSADGAKREALASLASALGLKVRDEDAAIEALESLIYHCSEG